MSYHRIIKILKGGPTSGNYGHVGRPGKIGGSQSKGMAALVADSKLWWANLTKDERWAVGLYQHTYGTNTALDIQNYVRGNYYATSDGRAQWDTKQGFTQLPSSKMTRIVELKDSALAKAPTLQEDMIVYRGIDADRLPGGRTSAAKPGDVFHDVGYMSTSTSDESVKDLLKHYIRGKIGAQITYEIIVPKGTKAAFLEITGNPFVEGENELLFPRDVRVKVTNKLATRRYSGELL